MFNRKLTKETFAEIGRRAEHKLRNYHVGPVSTPMPSPSNEAIAQELAALLTMGVIQGTMADLIGLAAARLAICNVVMLPPNMGDEFQGSIHGPLEHLQAEQIAASAVVQHHFGDKHNRVHVVICDQEGTVRSRQIMGEAASKEWLDEFHHRNRH